MTESTSDPQTQKSSLHPVIAGLLGSVRPGDPHVHNGLGLWSLFAPARFLTAAAKAYETQHDTPGLGQDHRIQRRRSDGVG